MIEVLNLSALVLRNCIRKLFQAIILILFFGSIFILLGKQLYKGILTQKCVTLPPLNISEVGYAVFVSNSSNWLETKNGYYLCGNSTGSRPCPQNYTCLKGADVNTYVSNFNFYASSVVTISQLMTLHFWQELYQRMLLTAGSLHVIYFVLAFYSFLYSSGLILAIITRSYKNVLKEFEVVERNQPLPKRENSSRCDLQKGIAKSPSCKSYELFTSQVITSDKIERQTSEILESSSRSTDKSYESDRIVRDHLTESTHKKEALKSHLADTVNGSVESTAHQYGIAMFFSIVHHRLQKFMSSYYMEVFSMTCIATFLCITLFQCSHFQIVPPDIYRFIYYGFAGETFLEVTLKVICYSPKEFFRSKWNAYDGLILIIGGTEMVLLEVEHPILFILRSYKLVKILICCKTCTYLKHVMGSCLFLFRHPLSILFVFIIICIVTGMQLYGYEYFYSSERFPNQDPPRWYFKNCYSSFLLVFCMLCGDWKQPMVNTVLFTSCASDLLMLIFVLIGNFVIINLFLGVTFYIYFYKSVPRSSYSRDKLQNAIQIILKGQETFADQRNMKENKSEEAHTSHSISSEILSETNCSSSQSFSKNKRKKLNHQNEMEIVDGETTSEYMADCCPSLCYFCCSFCKADENPVLWQNWADVRCRLYCFVETQFFQAVVSFVILASIGLLIIDRSYEAEYFHGAKVIETLDPCIFVLFLFEMVLKWMAYGLQKFFKSHLGRFEFFILLVYLVDLLSIKFFDGQKNIFKALRSFRLLSLTSLLESYQETVPLPLKRNVFMPGSETASRESLLHFRQLECNHFLSRPCRYRPSGSRGNFSASREIFQMDWNVPEIHSSDLSNSKMHRIQIVHQSEFSNKHPSQEASDCLPSVCYRCCVCCRQDCSFFHFCTKLRTKATRLLRSYYVVGFVIIIIITCCAKLVMECTFTENPAIVEEIANYADKVFLAIFAFEILIKLFILGFRRYFTEFWCILEFIITMAQTIYVVLNELNYKDWYILKLFVAFRILYICKILKCNKQSQMILKSLKYAVPSYAVVFIFIFCLWLVFAVMGTVIFSKKMFHCFNRKNEDLGAMPDYSCNTLNGTLKSVPTNFNTVGNTYIALLQVATLQNWIDFVTEIMDNSNKTNYIKNQVYTATFFPLFITFSTFLTLNFFVGITCCCFNNIKRESEKKSGTQSKNLYQTALKAMEKIKLKKTIPPPKLHFQAFLYRMVISDNFEIAGFVFIGLHMLLIALDMYDPDPSEMFALAMTELNVFFIVIFTVESILKVIGLRQYFFLSFWNHFDLIVLALCICGALFVDLFPSPMLPAMLRLLRFIQCRRYLRRYARGMLPLLYSLYTSIPAFFTMVILQFFIMFIYAVFGIYFFKNMDQLWDISGELCFKTFPKAMLLLFQLSTLAGWVDVLESLLISGKSSLIPIIFVVSYITIVYYIVIKTHLVVILDSYDSTMQEYENILLHEDYEMFAEVWQKFDNNARGIIKFGNLPDLLDVLEEPFHFCKPNRFLIATLNIPIYEGDLVFYADIMDALTRDFMSHRAHLLEASDTTPGLRNNEGKTLKKIGSSLWRQRQNYCANIIQRAWRQYTGKLAQSPVFYSEVRLTSEGDKVDTFLTAEVRSSSHASV